MKCIVVDDEIPARDEIIYLLKETSEFEIVGEASNGIEAYNLIKKHKLDVVFLDINMPKMDGFDLVKEMLSLNNIPYIVFVTAYDQYAIKAFEVNAIDYILKPINKKRLMTTIERLRIAINNGDDSENYSNKIDELVQNIKIKRDKVERICVYKNGKYIPLNPKDISFITTVGRNTIIRSKIGEFTTSLNLSELEEKLFKSNFFRSHRSFLVNLDEVKEIHNWFNGTFQIVLNGFDEKVSVSRNKASEFKEIMNI